MTSRVAAFIARRWCAPESSLRVETEHLHGGLESTVERARVWRTRHAGAMPSRLVVKHLRPGSEREADVYDLLWRHLRRPPTARLLGRDVVADRTCLYLEDVRSCASWPWSDAALSGAVCRALARFHESAALPREPFAWDYESELARSADATLHLAREARDGAGRRCWRRMGDLGRVVDALPRVRRRLLAAATTVIHGDVHPGNVLLRATGTDRSVVLIDWGRARVGCPMEDVASWLHSLGCWEPEARRRHDTLMRTYLTARRVPRAFTADVRTEYWLASASNGLSGAIRYHLAVLSDGRASGSAHYDSARALAAWQRVVRRAATLLNTSLDR